MQGRLIDISYGLNRRQRVTVEISGDFSGEYDRLKNTDVDVEIKKHRKQRSLTANAYAWVLVDKIAEALILDKASVYKNAIREIGGVSEIVCVQEGAVDRLRSAWEANGIGWQAEAMPSKIEGCANVILWYGSSTYDTRQMYGLISRLIDDCRGLGIETRPEDEIKAMMAQWGTRDK